MGLWFCFRLGAGDRTQGIIHARQASIPELYPHPEILILIHPNET
jgi:hypothetical protein